MFPVLSLVIFLPFLSACFVGMVGGTKEEVARNSRWIALLSSGLTLLISVFLLFSFDPSLKDFQFSEHHVWIESLNIAYSLGIDGVAVLFIFLTAFLIFLCCLVSFSWVDYRVQEYMVAFLVLETAILGFFASRDLLLFYFFFEASLIPMFIIIGVWGGQRRVYSAFKLFLFTLFGSLFMLAGIIDIIVQYHSSNFSDLAHLEFSYNSQLLLFCLFFLAFAIKIPMFPFHIWLPDAHVEAPTAGSVVLAGILLKMGGYALLRFHITLFPLASKVFAPYVMILSIIAVIYASLLALAQQDMKKMIAYSSIAHMGIVTAGLFSFNILGVSGAILQMLSHGFISSALFLVIGILYERLHTRELSSYGSLSSVMPVFSFFVLFFTMASVGLPGTSGFSSEFLALTGIFSYNFVFASLLVTGVVLSALYMLVFCAKLLFGDHASQAVAHMQEASYAELFSLASLCILSVSAGIYPSFWINFFKRDLVNLLLIVGS